MSLWLSANRLASVRFFIFRIWQPFVDLLLSNLEALFFLRKRGPAIRELLRMREELLFTEDISFWYDQRRFEWRQDPIHGRLDFSSKPWVSVARNSGDCDDMMVIAEFILASHAGEKHRAFTYNRDGDGHAAYLVKDGLEWSIVSNKDVRRGFRSPQDALRSFYRDETAFMYIYNVGYFEGGKQ